MGGKIDHWSLDVCRLVAQWCGVPFVPRRYGEVHSGGRS